MDSERSKNENLSTEAIRELGEVRDIEAFPCKNYKTCENFCPHKDFEIEK
jgi:NAD-dependent dihydropyrimidine dehydrogenase PreA subunit